MQVAIPHQLSREEVRRRLKGSSHKIGDAVPGGMAEIATSWPSEDRMQMSIMAMGQNLAGHIDITDNEVLLVMNLPPALSFLEPMIAGTIRQQGERMLEAPRGD